MRQLGRQIEENLPEVSRRTALAVHNAVVFATPVDEGVARVNWQPSLVGPVTTTREASPPGQNGSTAAENATAAIDLGRAVISGYQGETGIYISNPLPYIGRLNEGSSAQAPANFVEEAVQVGVRTVRNSKVLDD